MLCKERVCEWYRGLSGQKRLELMSGLLHVSLPLELRFIGALVEDLARKNYHVLREAEIKANDLATVRALTTNLLDPVTRCQLNIYLALLHSTNVVCSNALFNTLTCLEPLHQCAALTLPGSVRLREEILLLFTMAANHPAFTFSQRQVLLEKLMVVQRILDCSDKDKLPNSTNASNVRISPTNTAAVTQQNSVPTECSVFAKSIDIKGSQRTPDRRHEFHLQVKWSDGKVSETFKTYQAFHSFHTDLVKLFPKESGAHKQERQIPFFPSEKGPGHTGHGEKELTDLMRKYVNQLVSLPKHILQCDHTIKFLQTETPEIETRTPLTLQGTEDKVAPNVHKGSVVFYNSNLVEARRSSSEHTRSPGRHPVPTASASLTNSHSYSRHLHSKTTSSSSPHSSPLASPLSSPYLSPSASHFGSRFTPPWSNGNKFDACMWLKSARLHKYQGVLGGFSIDELVALDDNQLDAMGLTQGAKTKFMFEVDKLRMSTRNGVVSSGGCLSGYVSASASSLHSPPHSSVHLSPPPPQPPVAGAASSPHPTEGLSQHTIGKGTNSVPPAMDSADSVESSAVDGSEILTPPMSPGPEDTRSDSRLMDEVDRENDKETTTNEWKEEGKDMFQSSVPQGAIVESRPQSTIIFPKRQTTNHSNSPFGLMPGGNELIKMEGGGPVPFPPGVVIPVAQLDPQQMQMLYSHRPGFRSQQSSTKAAVSTPPEGVDASQPRHHQHQLPVAQVIFDNGPVVEAGKPGSQEAVSSSASTTLSAVTAVDMPRSFHSAKSIVGYPPPGAVMSNAGNDGASATRPLSLALPTTASASNSTVTVAPASLVCTAASLDVLKGTAGSAIPSLQNVHATTVVTSNVYTPQQGVQTGSAMQPGFQAPGAPGSVNPGPVPADTLAQLPLSNVSTPIAATPATVIPQLSQTSAPLVVASQGPQPHDNPSVPCTTCNCSLANATGFPPIWLNHGLMSASFPLRVMPGSSDGLSLPNLTFSHPLPAMNLPNGVSPELVFNSQPPNFNMMQQPDNAPASIYVTSANGGVFSTAPPSYVPTATHSDTGYGKGKPLNCYNCGELGHRAVDCRELTMESLTRNGYHLNYRPKADSE